MAWVDALVTARDQICRDVFMDNETEDLIDRAEKILTLEPLPLNEVIQSGIFYFPIRL